MLTLHKKSKVTMQNTVLPVYMIGAPLLVVAMRVSVIRWSKWKPSSFKHFRFGFLLKHDKKMTSAPAYHLTMRMESYVQ